MTFSLGTFAANPLMAVVLLALLLCTLGASAYLALLRLKKHPIRLLLVWLSSTVASLCIIALAIDIQVSTNDQPTSVLITEGVSLEQLNTLKDEQNIFILKPVDESLSSHKIMQEGVVIQDPVQIFNQATPLQALHILGSGLSEQQWQHLNTLVPPEILEAININFSPEQITLGLVDISFQKTLAVGEFLEVTGRLQRDTVNSNEATIFELALLNPIGEVLTTQRIRAGESFNLSSPMKTQGQWLYRLQLTNPDSRLLLDEPIAISVGTSTPLQIFIKQSAPSFETRQFSNWASQYGTKLLIATQISKHKDIQQAINFNDDEIAKLSEPFNLKALQSFDLIILDGRAVLALSTEQIQALSRSVQQGLGVLILVDSELAASWPLEHIEWLDELSITPLDIASYSSIPSWPDSSIEEAIDINKADVSSSSQQILVTGNKGQSLVVKQNMGLGSIGLSLINTSYSWQTSGKTSEYSHYWQSLLKQLARPNQSLQWQSEDTERINFEDASFVQCLYGDANSVTFVILVNPQKPQEIPLTNRLLQPQKHCLTLWPNQSGWYRLQASAEPNVKRISSSTAKTVDTYGYVYSKENWQALRQSQAIAATEYVLKNHQYIASSNYYKNLNKFWVWVALVLALSILWVERKLF
ncbi:hypothetical protein [Paraglaciecola marina]|uniref:hypothetical protein n=1 Tax=Paraglaciecola marina TaxID=2500157 RepID=UPI00105BD816|nr:hypothetical protein [Paraglaciecola marina]